MFQKMNSILKGNGLDMNLIVFRCMMPPIASKIEGTAGVIEWIDECIPISTLFGNSQDSNVSSNWYYARQSDNPILNLLRDSNYDPEGEYIWDLLKCSKISNDFIVFRSIFHIKICIRHIY